MKLPSEASMGSSTHGRDASLSCDHAGNRLAAGTPQNRICQLYGVRFKGPANAQAILGLAVLATAAAFQAAEGADPEHNPVTREPRTAHADDRTRCHREAAGRQLGALTQAQRRARIALLPGQAHGP